MKCVKMIHTRTIMRVTDAEAEKLVKATLAQYCPKIEWKINVRDAANV